MHADLQHMQLLFNFTSVNFSGAYVTLMPWKPREQDAGLAQMSKQWRKQMEVQRS